MRTAILMIAHGSRHATANEDLLHVVRVLRERALYPIVEASFLELAEPAIEPGGVLCVKQGAEEVILAPYFLSAGIHVQRDLAAARDRLAERFPRVSFRLAEPFGRHPLLMEIVLDRIREATRSGPDR